MIRLLQPINFPTLIHPHLSFRNKQLTIMDRAKQAVDEFVSKAGHHDTTVEERVAPAVKKETVRPTQHEEINTAIDKEVHQDHYHRKVQPIHDTEVLPEQHIHNRGKVVNREFDNRDNEATERALRAEAGKIKDERTVTGTTHTQSHAPVVQGEQVHHHVHETIQPVIHKETIQPSVVHTTVPIHEVHHEQAKHHGTTTLPAMSMNEFKQQGGALGGSSERYGAFEGCPKGVHQQGCGHEIGSGPAPNKMTSSTSRSTATTGTSGISSSMSSSEENISSTTGTTGLGSSSVNTEKAKPSLLDRLNPMKDADGDGKRGFMR
ncbi:hypothetical protein QC763_300360 [Podospora pseudopauciseta]|uniref:Allergen n=1 Tax=Podospora pseudopauciseta TaxID=2093780 RepID=A0ABR0HEJ5_9PEZI|nr:hypothetical protein QC763_300360 [Podospora pseudopauciseta]